MVFLLDCRSSVNCAQHAEPYSVPLHHPWQNSNKNTKNKKQIQIHISTVPSMLILILCLLTFPGDCDDQNSDDENADDVDVDNSQC